MTDISPPEWIKYCSLCMGRHNAGHIMGNRYPVQERCSSCGREIKERKITRIASMNCYRFVFDEIIESQIDDKHKRLYFDSGKDAYNYAVETWGSSIANNYITKQRFDGKEWKDCWIWFDLLIEGVNGANDCKMQVECDGRKHLEDMFVSIGRDVLNA